MRLSVRFAIVPTMPRSTRMVRVPKTAHETARAIADGLPDATACDVHGAAVDLMALVMREIYALRGSEGGIDLRADVLLRDLMDSVTKSSQLSKIIDEEANRRARLAVPHFVQRALQELGVAADVIDGVLHVGNEPGKMLQA